MPTEVDELIVRLGGDASQFQRMMKDAIGELRGSASEIKKAAQEAESFRNKLEGLASTAQDFFAAIGLAGGLQALLKTWTVQEDALFTLNAAIQVNQRNVEGLFEQYQAFASSMQAVTTTGDEVTLAMLQQAESFGVTGDAAMRAARNAISLGAAVGMSAQAAMRMTVMLEQGNTMMLGRYIPSLRNITDEGARVAEAHRVLNNMFAVAQARAGTTSGRLQQLANTWGDLKEVIGETVSIAIIPFVRWLKMSIDAFHALDPETKRAIVTTVALTMAITGLSAAVRVASALFLLLQRRMLFITLISAGVALLIQRLGGLEAVMSTFENTVNATLGINPQAAFSANNQAFAAGLGLGENLTAGLKKGTEGVEGVLMGSAAAAAAIFGYIGSLQGGAKPPRSTGGEGGGATMPFESTWFGSQFQSSPLDEFWRNMNKLASDFWNMLPLWAQNAFSSIAGLVANFFDPQFQMNFWSTVAQAWNTVGDAMFRFVQFVDWLLNRIGLGFLPPAAGAATANAASAGGLTGAASVGSAPISFTESWFGAQFRAGGGPVSAGSPYIVGENGPELFSPNVSGQISPISQSGGRITGFGSGGSMQILQLINENLRLIRRQKLMVGVGRIG